MFWVITGRKAQKNRLRPSFINFILTTECRAPACPQFSFCAFKQPLDFPKRNVYAKRMGGAHIDSPKHDSLQCQNRDRDLVRLNHKKMKKIRYKLASGTQVREEDFGLLFYSMTGPRLFFMSSGDLINSDFFQSKMTLEQWVGKQVGRDVVKTHAVSELENCLRRLTERGVILEY
jgi:putative mycofactocin binding protein MftB